MTAKHTPGPRCGFCYDREQGKHGAIVREWSPEWLQFIPVCRKHALADGMDGADALLTFEQWNGATTEQRQAWLAAGFLVRREDLQKLESARAEAHGGSK